MRCDECGAEMISVARSARGAFPSGYRCRRLFAHGSRATKPEPRCEEPFDLGERVVYCQREPHDNTTKHLARWAYRATDEITWTAT